MAELRGTTYSYIFEFKCVPRSVRDKVAAGGLAAVSEDTDDIEVLELLGEGSVSVDECGYWGHN